MAENATSTTAAAQSTEVKEAPSTSNPPKGNKPKYRDRGSKSAHDDQFRRAAGAKAMAANDARLDQALFSHLISITTKFPNFNHTPQPVTATIPQTTRGIGFALQQSATFAHERKPFIGITVHQMYRVALAQNAIIRQKTTPMGHQHHPYASEMRFDAPPFYGFDIKMASHDRHFTPVVAVLSAFGNLSIGGHDYHGFLPQSGMSVTNSSSGFESGFYLRDGELG
ncbi:unnamed protein product [Nezara viridula]|uniref:Uncharacterized protein n=1 Tax=Nezara viridula TaxID=85310 RepID=A0A9P0EFA8_NEZVI|nr:unnamed protein product [Nezara viridula]